MAQRQASRVQLLLELVSVDARLASHDEVGLIDLEHAVESRHVEHEVAFGRTDRAAHPGPTAHRSDRDVILRGPAHHGRQLLSPRWPDHVDRRACLARAVIHHGQRPEVAHRSRVDCLRPGYLLQLGSAHFDAYCPASQPVRMGTPKPQGPL